MIFKSRKDISFSGIAFLMMLLSLLLIFRAIYERFNSPELIMSSFIAFIVLWIFNEMCFNTEYELTTRLFYYRNGPIKGSIAIEEINEIIVGQSLWRGRRPATAKNGLIIKYRENNKIYISPDTNDLFIEKVLELNESIKIIRKQKEAI